MNQWVTVSLTFYLIALPIIEKSCWSVGHCVFTAHKNTLRISLQGQKMFLMEKLALLSDSSQLSRRASPSQKRIADVTVSPTWPPKKSWWQTRWNWPKSSSHTKVHLYLRGCTMLPSLWSSSCRRWWAGPPRCRYTSQRAQLGGGQLGFGK